MRQRLYGEGHYNCYAMPLAHLPSNGDMLVGTVLMMMCKNLINTCKTVYIGENGTIRLITDNMAPTINAQKQIILKQEHKDIATRKNEIS